MHDIRFDKPPTNADLTIICVCNLFILQTNNNNYEFRNNLKHVLLHL